MLMGTSTFILFKVSLVGPKYVLRQGFSLFCKSMALLPKECKILRYASLLSKETSAPVSARARN